MKFVEISWQSDLYQQEIDLRDRLLRAPLGLRFSDEELAAESSEYHFGMLDRRQLIACAVIVPLSDVLAKLRQMAVAASHQRRGVGSILIGNIERVLQDRQFQMIRLHARENAVEFYEKLGYRKRGPRFIEVGVPHWKMTKSIAARS